MTLKCMQSLLRVQARVCHQRRNLLYQPTFRDNSIYPKEEGRINTHDEQYWDRNASKNIEDTQGLLHETQLASQSPRKDASLIHQFRRWDQNEHVYENWEWDSKLSLHQRDRPHFTCQCSPSPQNETYHYRYRYQQQRLDSNTVISSPQSPSFLSRIKPSMSLSLSLSLSQREEAERNLKPSYMSATASAMARIRPQSAPRRRILSTTDHQGDKKTTSARKRLSFNLSDKYNSSSNSNYNYNGGSISDSEVRSPLHMTDERRLSMSSCRKHRVEDEISRPSVCQQRRWFN